MYNSEDKPFHEYVRHIVEEQNKNRVTCKLISSTASCLIVIYNEERYYIDKNYTSLFPDFNNNVFCDQRFFIKY